MEIRGSRACPSAREAGGFDRGVGDRDRRLAL